MDVTFRATPDLDLVTEAAIEVHRDPIRVLRLTGLVLTAIFAVLAVVGPDLFGLSGAVATFMFTVVVPVFFVRQAASTSARFICVDTEYTVGPAGVTSRTTDRDSTVRWPLVIDVVETPELVLLRLRPGGGLALLPIGGLDDATRAQVLGLVRRRDAGVIQERQPE